MGTLFGYTLRRCTFSQHWVPPWVLAVLTISISYAPHGAFEGSIAIGTVVLMLASAWLTTACLGSEAASQTDVLAVASGPARVQLAKLAASLCAAFALAPVSFVYAWLRSGHPPDRAVTFWAFASHLVACLVGVGIGGIASRPFVHRAATSFLVAAVLCVADIALPHAPPGRALVQVWSASPLDQRGRLALVCAESLLLGAALIAISTVATVRRR